GLTPGENARLNQCRRERGEVRASVRAHRNRPDIRPQLVAAGRIRHANRVAVEEVAISLREQEDVLMAPYEAVAHLLRGVVRLRPDDLLAQVRPCVLHSERETPRNAHKLLVLEAVEFEQLLAPMRRPRRRHAALVAVRLAVRRELAVLEASVGIAYVDEQ